MSRWVAVVFVVFGIGVYAASASIVGFDEVVDAVTMVSLNVWLAILLLSLANYALRFGRWAIYLHDPSRPVPFGRHFAIYMAGFALTPTPSKVGEAVRALYLKPFGIGYGRCLAAFYVERLLDVMVVSALAALILMSPASGVRWIGAVGGALALVLLALQHPAMLRASERLVHRLPSRRIRTIGGHVLSFQHQVTALMTGRLLATGLGVGLLAWVAEGFGLYLVAREVGIDAGPLIVIGIYSAAVLAGALSFLPGGLGSTEVVMISLFVSVGAPAPAAVAATAICRLATLWFAIVLGAVAWFGIEAIRSPARSQVSASPGGDPAREFSHAEPRNDPGR